MEPRPARPIPVWLGAFGPRALAVTGRLDPLPRLHARRRHPRHAPPHRRRRPDAGQPSEAIRGILSLAIRLDPGAQPLPEAVTGTARQVLNQLQHLRRLGFTGFNFLTSGPDRATTLQQIANDGLPALRSTG
jgi:hypothetical protein